MALSNKNYARPEARPYWPAPIDDGRIPSLDGVRAVAILLVLVAHLSDPTQTYSINRDQLGLLGVELFFVLSGFLISTLLLDEESLTGRMSMRSFYLRRAFRIFPAAYTFILGMVLLSLLDILQLTGRDLLHAVTYTTNYYSWEERSWQIGHLWSLAVEEQFYLLWPVALVALSTRWRLGVLAVVVVGCPILRQLYFSSGVPGLSVLATESFETTADALAFGCLLAFARPWLHRWSAYRWATGFWLTPAVLALAIFAINQSASILAILGPLQYSAIYLLLALLLDSSVSQSKRSLPSLLLNNPVAAFLGGLSYSLYLWQQPFMNPNTDAWWTQAPQGLLFAIGAAMVSHYAVEKPFMRMRRAFERKRGTNSVTTENSAVPTTG